MAYEPITIRDIIDRAVNHKWSIPEFQRGFVWRTTQVRGFAESPTPPNRCRMFQKLRAAYLCSEDCRRNGDFAHNPYKNAKIEL
jgi:hypothetical protein